MTGAIDDVLRRLASGRGLVYFDPMWGNNGDKLIERGSRNALERLCVQLATSPNDARVVVLNGGGAMAPMWGGLDALVRYIESEPEEIIVLPSSFWPADAMHSVRHALERSSAKLTLFARERESYQRLLDVFGRAANIALGHDMAFELNARDLERLRSKTRQRTPYALVVERRDAEASTSIGVDKGWRVPFKQYVPIGLKRIVKRALHHRLAHDTEFARSCIQQLDDHHIGAEHVIYADVSQVTEFSFGDFLAAIIDANVVFTTRLHVAIVRNIVGKPCYLQPTGGEYRKNESVFEHSMRDAGHVRLLEA